MSWNYRVVRHEDHLRIYDVYYDEHGKPLGRHEDPTYIYGESVESLREQIDWILKATSKPILEASDFPSHESTDLLPSHPLTQEKISQILCQIPDYFEGYVHNVVNVEDVTSILWIILRTYFEKIESKDALSRFLSGFSPYCPAIGIPRLGLLIDIIWIVEDTDIAQLRQTYLGQIPGFLQDALPHYRNMTLLFYDPKNMIQDVEAFIASMKVGQINDVVVVRENNQ